MANINRRRFLGASGALTALGGAGLLSALNASKAHAADVTGYKALVCVFLRGGLDHADTVMPYDQASYDQLRGARSDLFSAYQSAGVSTRERQNLLRLNVRNAAEFGGRQFAFPAELSPLGTLFEAEDLAVVGSVGPLVEPTTRSGIASGANQLPPRLFSHNDQQSVWASLAPEGSRYGWGGRFADAAIGSDSAGNPLFTAITTANNDVFLSGEVARQYRVGSSGPSAYTLIANRSKLGSGSGSADARDLLEDAVAGRGVDSSNYFIRDVVSSNSRAIENNDSFKAAFDAAPAIATEFPDTRIGRQLRTVAQTIATRGALNVSRQVFLAATGGFDTHSAQTSSLPALQSDLAAAIAAFHTAMGEMGTRDQVTLFTASDFGRTVIDNGDGTDHGWGGHHMIIGGAVKGGRIYGDMPGFDIKADTYMEGRGRLIPSVSIEQYAATLGRWFGLDEGELAAALPNLGRFDSAGLAFV